MGAAKKMCTFFWKSKIFRKRIFELCQKYSKAYLTEILRLIIEALIFHIHISQSAEIKVDYQTVIILVLPA